MPYQGYEDGLYLVYKSGDKNGISVTHYGVLDIGNILSIADVDVSPNEPFILHQTPPTIRVEQISKTGNWQLMGMVAKEFEQAAIQRINEALKNPAYDLFGNNCEQFARYITTGIRESKQLQTITWSLVGIAALGMFVWKARSASVG